MNKRLITILTVLAFLMAPVLGHAAVSWVISSTMQTDQETAINNDVDAGVLKIYGANGTDVLATITLPAKTSNTLDDPSAGTITFGSITPVTAGPTSGTATTFKVFKNGGSTLLLTGNCGTASTAMVLNTTTITSGDTVSISSMTWSVPAGS